MKANELREKNAEQLKEVVIDLRKQQFELRMKEASGQLNTNHELGLLRKNIARVKTVLNESQGK